MSQTAANSTPGTVSAYRVSPDPMPPIPIVAMRMRLLGDTFGCGAVCAIPAASPVVVPCRKVRRLVCMAPLILSERASASRDAAQPAGRGPHLLEHRPDKSHASISCARGAFQQSGGARSRHVPDRASGAAGAGGVVEAPGAQSDRRPGAHLVVSVQAGAGAWVDSHRGRDG